MSRNILALEHHVYDLLIVGGGINGAALANMATQAGLKVALIDKGDFASGASSKSSKLLHGGIRYLENFEFDLVQEALKERYIQFKNAPHLVKPITFVIPVYKDSPRPLWMMKIGVWLYDLLSGPYTLGLRANLTLKQVKAIAPSINTKGLIAAVSYCDAQMNDARICLENILMAKSKGAVVANYIEANDFIKENTKCIGVQARDHLSGKIVQIRANQVISTIGPWTDKLLSQAERLKRKVLRPTKGVHLVYKGQISDKAFVLQAGSDKRIFFVIPFHGNTLIGTTDTDFDGSPDELSVSDEEIEYLLKEAGKVFAHLEFKKENIINTFAGIRPLVFEKGSTSKVSRKHCIERTFSGIWYIAGGKYTTYRAIAKEAIEKIFPQVANKLPDDKEYPLYGSMPISLDIKQTASYFGVDQQTVNHLISVYGSRYWDVLKCIDEDHSLRAKICTCCLHIRAQVVYALKVELACTKEDIIARRLQLQYNDCPSRQCYKTVDEICQHHDR